MKHFDNQSDDFPILWINITDKSGVVTVPYSAHMLNESIELSFFEETFSLSTTSLYALQALVPIITVISPPRERQLE